MTLASPLQHLRQVMKQLSIHAYIVPTEDAHQSEYIAKCDTRRAFISNFTGSAGTAVVTLEHAALWTDGRYYLQASQQLDPAFWTLQKFGLPSTPTQEEWLLSVLGPNSTVAVDPRLFTVTAAQSLRDKLEAGGHSFRSLSENLVDKIWSSRPPLPSQPVMVLDVKYAGQEFSEKIANVQKHLVSKNYWGVVVSALDEVAWLFNLRGSDIAFNPVFHSYALVTPTQAFLYVDSAKIDDKVRAHLGNQVTLKPYLAIFDDLKLFGIQKKESTAGEKLLIDQKCSLALLEALGTENSYVCAKSPIQMAKAIKNAVELQGFRDCHERDAAALCRYFAWLESELVDKKNTTLTEAAAADKLEAFRAELSGFMGLSFDTISSTGPNGAIIHYKPDHGKCATIDVKQIYLCDSGGQYLDGTTDCTRTLHFGTPTAEEKEAFTRVLKGHIQLDMAVHEGPQAISFRPAANETPLMDGMTITNEPGFYKDGAFGIRIENVLLVKKADTPNNFGDTGFLGFEHVTVVPIQTKLIEKSLLTPEEVQWINKYHQTCLERVSRHLDKQEEGFKWLARECIAI
ncbi:hypothetical protein HDU91_005965 [Kappamyces sp. JEL0680]|nr:hypothetical protein HDU91_005965 [Kappamyces sp. JEL0680]